MRRLNWIGMITMVWAVLLIIQCYPDSYARTAMHNARPLDISDSLRHTSRKNITMVTGRILTGKQNQPMPNANVFIQGTNEGTCSNAEGRFSLQVPVNTTLVCSHVGYLTERITIGLGGDMVINLKPGVFHILLPDISADHRLLSNVTRSPKRMIRTDDESYTILEQMPNFVYGGFTGLAMDIKHNTMAFTEETGLQGRVNIGFTIRANTEVTDFYVLQSDHPDLIAAAESIIRQVNGWIPGKQRGKPVDVRVSMVIDFD